VLCGITQGSITNDAQSGGALLSGCHETVHIYGMLPVHDAYVGHNREARYFHSQITGHDRLRHRRLYDGINAERMQHRRFSYDSKGKRGNTGIGAALQQMLRSQHLPSNAADLAGSIAKALTSWDGLMRAQLE